MRVRLPYKSKPNNYTESFAVNMADIRGKERVSTRGGLADARKKCAVTTNGKKSAEAIVLVLFHWEGPNNR